MKRLVMFAVVATVALSGCSLFKSDNGAADAETAFTQDDGTLTVKISRGEFVELKSKAAALVLMDNAAGRESAVHTAQERALANIAAFMNRDMKTSKTVEQKTKAGSDEETYARNTIERVVDNANALIKGAYVSKRTLDGDIAYVEVTVTKESIQGAKSLNKMMRSAK